jgi:5-methylcytosine-specific restriction enzyme subunit McrC
MVEKAKRCFAMIRIQNIYYMLAYAFTVLHEDGYKKLADEKFEHVADLLAAILAKGIAAQIKRGLGREYISKVEALSSPTGKIDVSASIKQQTHLKKQLICHFDDFTENAYMNQILKATVKLLICCPEVSIEQKRALKKVYIYLSNMDDISPHDIKWQSVSYHRNNATYKMLINICNLVISGMLLSEQEGSKKLAKYLDDSKMHKLFERFVLQYYRKHYPDCAVIPSGIDWNTDNNYIDLLPAMKSDITIEYGGRILIIDTKYYSRTMQTHNLYNSLTIHSGNLYQIFTYVKNKDIQNTGSVSGVLLYAKTDEEITPDNDYMMNGNKISVKTLDLDKPFVEIERQLNRLMNYFFGMFAAL